jgi:hypothetical protein
MKVRIIQLLCPDRHCIVEMPYQTEDGAEQPDKVARLKEKAAAMNLDPWCGICKSRQLTYLDRPTKFRTMDEAEPFFRQIAAEQLATRRFLDALS